jgi:two-component system cell cycle sensor histidine kinase/response regulator CckA
VHDRLQNVADGTPHVSSSKTGRPACWRASDWMHTIQPTADSPTPTGFDGGPDRGMSLLSGMLRGTRDHVAIKALDGRYLYVNPAAAEWFGLPVESIVGRTNVDLWGDTEAAAIAERDHALLELGQPMEYEEVLERDGVTRTWLTTKEVIRDEAGGAIAHAAISREITERVAADRALARSDEALRRTAQLLNAIVDTTTDHISVRDVDGRFLLVNRAVAGWYGGPAESMLGRTCAELFGPEYAAAIAERDRLFFASGVPMSYEETQTRQGATRSWLTTRDMIRDDAGGIVAHFAISHEITELKRAEEQSMQSQKMESIGRLAGGIAHDFNNLLTVISGNAQFLLVDLVDHPGRAAAQEIATAADRAATVTRQLLAFSRQQVLAPEVLDVRSIVRDIEPLFRRLVGEDVDIETQIGTLPGLVRVDRSQLEQALLNLVINARDAMPEGGKLTIGVAAVDQVEPDPRSDGASPGPYVLLTVADTGSGIEAGVLGHIIEPFFTTKGPGKGTGLGLSMVDGVVRQSGGHLWVDTEVGVGTTFRIQLPRVLADNGAPPPVAALSRDPGGHEVILLVEDERGVRQFASQTLDRAGYRVLEASGPAAAALIIEERGADIDLLLTDVVMPGGTGPQVAHMLESANARAVVLFMSGYTDDAISHQGVLEPGVTLIAKPFSAEALLAAVRSVLGMVALERG